MNNPNKNVLIIQDSEFQAQVWRVALISQRVPVTLDSSAVGLAERMTRMAQGRLTVPDLLLIEIGLLNKKHFDFSRWCRDHFPAVQIVFTDSTRPKISDTEHRWANSQGVRELIAGFQTQNFLEDVTEKIGLVLTALGWWPLQKEALLESLNNTPEFQSLLPSSGASSIDSQSELSGFLASPFTSVTIASVAPSGNGAMPSPQPISSQPVSGFAPSVSVPSPSPSSVATPTIPPIPTKKVTQKPPEEPPTSGRSYRGALR